MTGTDLAIEKAEKILMAVRLGDKKEDVLVGIGYAILALAKAVKEKKKRKT